MSNEQNTIYIENLQNRMSEILPYITPGDTLEFERLVNQGQLEEAQEFVTTLEDIHADDLR